MGPLPRRTTLGIDMSIGSFQEHVAAIIGLGAEHRSSYVCCVNAHMCVEADRDPSFKAVVNGADLATADGMPMLKAVNTFHKVGQERVAGNDLLPALFAAAERRGLSIFLYGGQQQVLNTMVANAAREYPSLRIAGTLSPPFRPLTAEEMDEHARTVNSSGAHIVMVSLGCPKQERWMAAMKGKVQGVMLGLGGAFLLYAGVDTRAPKWMRDLSMEWVYRLALEPRRLFKRYLVTNSLFVGLFLRAWFGRG